MAENMTSQTCQNLSNIHIVKHWNKWSPTEVARELACLGLSRYPPSLREDVLKGS